MHILMTGQTTTTTTTPGNLFVSGITTATNRIDIKSDDSTPGRILTIVNLVMHITRN